MNQSLFCVNSTLSKFNRKQYFPLFIRFRRDPSKRIPLKMSRPTMSEFDLHEHDDDDHTIAIQEIETLEDTLTDLDISDRIINKELQKMQKSEQHQLKMKILTRKYFKPPQEVNLLTWAAKQQMRFLNQQDPAEWTIEKLAESFPVSKYGVIKTLNSSYIPKSALKIKHHDERVRNQWLALKSGNGELGGPIGETYEYLCQSNQLRLMIHAGGNERLPCTSSEVAVTPKVKSGPFESLVKDYVEKKTGSKKTNRCMSTVTSEADHLLLKSISESAAPITMGQDAIDKIVKEDEIKPLGGSIQLSKGLTRREKRSIQEGKEGLTVDKRNINLLQVLKTKKVSDNRELIINSTDRGKELEDVSHGEFQGSASRSNKESGLERVERQGPADYNASNTIRYDCSSDGKSEPQSYMYDEEHGYQHPFGKFDEDVANIDISKQRKNRPCIYKKGDIVYDDDGEFLYRIP